MHKHSKMIFQTKDQITLIFNGYNNKTKLTKI